MIDGNAVKGNQQRMETLRSSYEATWAEIARLVYPEMNQFYGGSLHGWARTSPYKPAEMHDPYGAQALEDGVAVFEGFVMPKGQRWQKLALPRELMRSIANQQWVEQVEQVLFAVRHDPDSGFVSAVHESAMSLHAFAAQSMWIEPRYSPVTGRPLGLTYQSEFVGEIFVEFDAAGRPMRMHRKFSLTAEQAMRKFGADTPALVQNALVGKDGQRTKDSTFTFLHVIEPNLRFDPQRMDAAGMAWSAGYYLNEGDASSDKLFRTGGYRSLPRIFSTWSRGVPGSWGFSPTMRVLPMIKLLQEIQAARTFGAELRLLPPLAVADDELDQSVIEMSPLGVTRGAIDDRGNRMVQELFTGSDSMDAEKLAIEAREAIDRAYQRHLLQLFREQKTHITATRTVQEQSETGVLLASMSRQESEWLSPMTQRELWLIAEMGLLPEMPGEVAEYLANDGGIDWTYDNQLNRLIKSQDTVSIMSLTEQVAALAQFDEGAVRAFNREFPAEKVMRVLGENAGVPASMRATDEERAAFDQAEAQRVASEQLLQAAPVLADAAKNAAAAGAMATGQ